MRGWMVCIMQSTTKDGVEGLGEPRNDKRKAPSAFEELKAPCPGDPEENRTPVWNVRGSRPNR
jgi:hypothetical protein